MSTLAIAEPGAIIAGRFRLETELGAGGMGAVWKATQLNLDRPVALKVLHPEYAVQPEARARFEREARVASALKHPHVVQIYDFGASEDQLFIAMEMLRGGSLRAIVDEELPVQPTPRVVQILTQVADALAAAHDIGLVHRDLKPENIFLERSDQGLDRAVVVDFGLAFIADQSEKLGRLTHEGIVTGTPEYMPPEQVKGKADIGPPADVYALGCILYEMLTSRVPFVSDTLHFLLSNHVFTAPEPPSVVRPDLRIPRELEELCLAMLAKEPASRPSMALVRSALAQDGAASTTSERGRGEEPLVGRAARMISTIHSTRSHTLADLSRPVSETAVVCVVGGDLSSELTLGLQGNAITSVARSAQELLDDAALFQSADAIFAPSASTETIQQLLKLGCPVLTDVDSSDLERMTALLREGVADVVHRPISAAELSRRLWRVIHRARRRNGRSS